MRLGPDATLDDIITKLRGVFGLVETSETLLTDFYAARQRDDECVVPWGCRLEDLLDRARQQGVVEQKNMKDMLCIKFWGGLTWKLKDASRYKFDTIRDFGKLHVELRTIEQDYKDKLVSTSSTMQQGFWGPESSIQDGHCRWGGTRLMCRSLRKLSVSWPMQLTPCAGRCKIQRGNQDTIQTPGLVRQSRTWEMFRGMSQAVQVLPILHLGLHQHATTVKVKVT